MIHPTKTHPTLIPKYVSEFRCIGSSCEDTCCGGWVISLDKKTYNVYQQSKLPQLQDLFQKYTKRLRSGQHDSQYGVIVLHPEKKNLPDR